MTYFKESNKIDKLKYNVLLRSEALKKIEKNKF